MFPLWNIAAAIIRRQTGDCSRKERQEGRGGGAAAAAAACWICSRTSTSGCCRWCRANTNSSPGRGGGRGGVCCGEGLGATCSQGASGVSAKMEGLP